MIQPMTINAICREIDRKIGEKSPATAGFDPTSIYQICGIRFGKRKFLFWSTEQHFFNQVIFSIKKNTFSYQNPCLYWKNVRKIIWSRKFNEKVEKQFLWLIKTVSVIGEHSWATFCRSKEILLLKKETSFPEDHERREV